ncbi:MAG: hypothetical protein QXK18_06090 [Candidatus Bathyarchaeia archaeon]
MLILGGLLFRVGIQLTSTSPTNSSGSLPHNAIIAIITAIIFIKAVPKQATPPTQQKGEINSHHKRVNSRHLRFLCTLYYTKPHTNKFPQHERNRYPSDNNVDHNMYINHD